MQSSDGVSTEPQEYFLDDGRDPGLRLERWHVRGRRRACWAGTVVDGLIRCCGLEGKLSGYTRSWPEESGCRRTQQELSRWRGPAAAIPTLSGSDNEDVSVRLANRAFLSIRTTSHRLDEGS